MEVGTQTRIIGFILCAVFITISTQAPAAIKDHEFLFLGIRANDTLGCYKSAKGFPSTPYKGKLSGVIGLAPTNVRTWKDKDEKTRYSLCLSALEGFQDPLSTVIASEKGQPDFTCTGDSKTPLSKKLDNLSQRLIRVMEALRAYKKGTIQSSGVRVLDMTQVLKTARTVAPNWPPPSGTTPQSLVNYVILDQFKDTVQSIRQYNVCPVPL